MCHKRTHKRQPKQEHAVHFHKIGALVRFKPSEVWDDFETGRLGRIGGWGWAVA